MKLGAMLRTGGMPSNFTVISLLCSRAGLRFLSTGSQVHGAAIKLGLDLDVSVSNSLLTMYGECGSISECWKAFHSMPDYDGIR